MEKSNICKKLAVFVIITVILAVFAGCIGGKEETPTSTTTPTQTTPTETEKPTAFVVEGLRASEDVKVGDAAIIYVDVRNDGNSGYGDVIVWVGAEEISQNVYIEKDDVKTSEIPFTFDQSGEIKVRSDGLSINVTVEEKETIRLVVEQSYPQIEEEFSLAFANVCRQILESVGFNVVDEKATQYDYTLLVEVTGKALGAFYKESMSANFLGDFLYTGASIDGSFSLSGPNTDITRSFYEKKSPPDSYTYASESSLPKKPRNAPFRSLVWEKHFFLLIYDAWGIEPIIKALEDEDSMVRLYAAEALGEISAKEVVPALIKALEDEGYRVRRNAAEALGEIGPEAKEAVPALIKALEDEDEYVRSCAAEALGKIGAKEAIPALIKALDDVYAMVGHSASIALGDIGDQEAVPALIEALGDERVMVRTYAAEALAMITGEDFGMDQSKWQQWWEENK